MSRTFKKFDGENNQREQYYRSQRVSSKRKKTVRQQTPSHYLVDGHDDEPYVYPQDNMYVEYYD